jgi:hypothetical protein
MKKKLTAFLVACTMALSPALKADAPASEEEGTPVGQAANEGSNAAKKKQWQNIALATGAVALAVTALLLVASNDGHHVHSKKNKS